MSKAQKNIEKLPSECYGVLLSNKSLIRITAGEAGYHKLDQKVCEEQMSERGLTTMEHLCQKLNESEDVTPADRAAMEWGSQFGWETKLANLQCYNEAGKPYVGKLIETTIAFSPEWENWYPEKVFLDFDEATIARIKEAMVVLSRPGWNSRASIRLDFVCLYHNAWMDTTEDHRPDYLRDEQLIIRDGYVVWYVQSKHDAATQYESESITCEDLGIKLPDQEELKIAQVDQAKKVLEDAGYYCGSLFQVADVNYKCTDDQAYKVLDRALQNDATMEQIWLAIDIVAEGEGLTKKEEES